MLEDQRPAVAHGAWVDCGFGESSGFAMTADQRQGAEGQQAQRGRLVDDHRIVVYTADVDMIVRLANLER